MTENSNYDPDYCYECGGYRDDYYTNIAAQSVHMTASDAHFTSIARSASWGVREIRAR